MFQKLSEWWMHAGLWFVQANMWKKLLVGLAALLLVRFVAALLGYD